MHIARSIVERTGFALLKLAATCQTAVAVALTTASFALWAIDSESLWVISSGVLLLAVVFAVAGSATIYLARRRTKWLPDDPLFEASAASSFNGWLTFWILRCWSCHRGQPALRCGH